MENGPVKAERAADLLEVRAASREQDSAKSTSTENAALAGLAAGQNQAGRRATEIHGLSPLSLMRLQRSAGNAAIASMFERPPVQREPDGGSGTAVADPPVTIPAAEHGSPPGAIGSPPSAPPAGSQPPPTPTPRATPDAASPQSSAPMQPVSSVATAAPETGTATATGSQGPDGVNQAGPLPAPALPQVGGPAAAVFAAFAASTIDVRASMVQSADATTQRIRAAADLQKSTLQATAVTEARGIDDAFSRAAAQVKQTFTDAQQQIVTERDSRVAGVRSDATAKLADLSKGIADQRAALMSAAEEKAGAATQAGEEQAARAVSETRVMGTTAVDIGSRKAAEWAGHPRGAEIARVASDMASGLARELTDNGNAMAAQARKDAGSLAAKFRQEADDVAGKLATAQATAEAKIEETRDASIQKIGDLARAPIEQLHKQAVDLVDQLETQRSDAGQQLPLLAQAAAASVEKAATDAIGSVSATAADSTAGLDSAVATVAARVDGAGKHQAKLALDLAAAGIAAQVTEYNGQLGTFGQQTETALASGAADAAGRISTQAGTMIGPVQDSASNFTSTADKTSGATADEMQQVSGAAGHDMTATVDQATGEVTKAVDAGRAQWEQDLTAGIGEIKGKVDQGLAGGRTELEGLAAKIDAKGHEIEDESWLTRAWHFTEGFFTGFFKALGELLLVLLIVVIAVVVLAIVVLAVAALIGGLAGILAVIGAVAAVIGAISGALAWIAIIVAVVIVLIALYKIVKALTQDNLTDFERGSLWGSAVFDILTIVFGAKIVKWLATWIEGLRDAEELAELAELRGMVKDEELLQRLLKLTSNDPAELKAILALLNNDGPMTEKLLLLTGGDGAGVKGLLSLCGNDGAVVEKVLIASGSDVGKATKLLTLAGENPATVTQLLDLADDNPERIFELFEKNGGDANKVLDELGQAKAPEGSSKPQLTLPTDPERLAQVIEIRTQYLDGIANMEKTEAEMRAAGKATEEIARRLVMERNSLKLMTRALNTPEEVAQMEARNMKSWYHDPVGPTPDQAFERYGTWESVIEKAKQTDHALNRLLGLE